MKNVYTDPVLSYGKVIKKQVAKAAWFELSPVFGLRVRMAVAFSFLLLVQSINVKAQNCPTTGTDPVAVNENTYYQGLGSVATGATSLSVGPIGSGTGFNTIPIAPGDIVLIIQMQGARFNLPASNTQTVYGANVSGLGAGMITNNLQAGKMEFAIATNAVPAGGGVLNFTAGLTNAYTNAPWGTDGQYTYQVIRVPGHFNLQLTTTIITPQWNGSTGGVTVLSAVNQFNFNGQKINAVGAGFRGGGGRALGGASTLFGTTDYYYTSSTLNANGSKAEGIAGTPRYVTVNNLMVDNGAANEGYPGGSYARGAPGNAGGGATDTDPPSNDQNAGGGGGGNGGAGGLGGWGWFSGGVTGGKGGTAFQTFAPTVVYYSPSRLILGGGGGAGSTNNSSGTPGGGQASGGSSGGGLVIVNATTFTGAGTIDASGASGNSSATVDGSGGGGAGGSILIYANSGQGGITAISNGGNGGSNSPGGATQHGPGGGGGGGVIISNAALNAASTVKNGVAGFSYGSGFIADSNYGAKPGVAGVLKTTSFPLTQLPPNMQICQAIVLPVTIVSFNATYVSTNNVKVAWTTTDEINADYFVVERSTDGASFGDVGQVDASQSSNPVHSYTLNDQLYNINSSILYYRLRIVDNSGKFTYSKIVPVKLDQPETSISVYPNPVDNYTILNLFSDKETTGVIRLIDNSGKQIITKTFTVTNGNNSILVDQLGVLPRGIYFIQVLVNNSLYNQKIVKK